MPHNLYCAKPWYHNALDSLSSCGWVDRISDVWQSIAAWVVHGQFHSIITHPGGEVQVRSLNVCFWVLSPKLDSSYSGSRLVAQAAVFQAPVETLGWAREPWQLPLSSGMSLPPSTK